MTNNIMQGNILITLMIVMIIMLFAVFMLFFEIQQKNDVMYDKIIERNINDFERYVEISTYMKDTQKSITELNMNQITNNHNEYYGSNTLFYPRTFRQCTKQTREFYANGQSMFPLFNNGDKLYAEQISFEDVELGDVIVYTHEDRTIIHSVVYISDKYLKTAGYNNFNEDHIPITRDMLKYRHCVVI